METNLGHSDVGCKTVANMIKGKTPEEIRKLFNIVNDFTPEEEAQIKKENVSGRPRIPFVSCADALYPRNGPRIGKYVLLVSFLCISVVFFAFLSSALHFALHCIIIYLKTQGRAASSLMYVFFPTRLRSTRAVSRMYI